MKKVILLTLFALLLFAAGVSAGSLNGEYQGFPIVKIVSNGVTLESDEVPAHVADGHTLVPISLLRQIGLSVNWNAQDYSVDVKLPIAGNKIEVIQGTADVRAILKDTAGNLKYLTVGNDLVAHVDFYQRGANFDEDWPAIRDIVNKLTELDVQIYSVDYLDKRGVWIGSLSADRKSSEDFFYGRITEEELNKRWKVSGFEQNTANHEQPSNQPSDRPSPQPAQPTVDQHKARCEQIRESYVLKLAEADRSLNPFSGQASYARTVLEKTRDDELARSGCN